MLIAFVSYVSMFPLFPVGRSIDGCWYLDGDPPALHDICIPVLCYHQVSVYAILRLYNSMSPRLTVSPQCTQTHSSPRMTPNRLESGHTLTPSLITCGQVEHKAVP